MKTELLIKARDFFKLFYDENDCSLPFQKRFRIIQNEIKQYGTYFHTFEELEFGAMVAWRNSNRCIGRLYWKSLNVIDERGLNDVNSIQEALINHVKISTNRGAIKPSITIFRQKMPNEINGIRIHNTQLINYAGHSQVDATIVGDPNNVAFTDVVKMKGWQGQGTNFDVLPILFELPNHPIHCFELPQNAILEVPIVHPYFEWMADLQLKWYALPTISNMLLEIGGIEYTAAPFSGWYMATEIGARNFADVNRYNQLPIIAQKMGLDIHQNHNLWKDRALIELTQAVLYSFDNQGIRISNHHVAAEHFMVFQKQEKAAGRNVNADWAWIVPPISAAATPVFHSAMTNEIQSPNFFYQPPILQQTTAQKTIENVSKCPFHNVTT